MYSNPQIDRILGLTWKTSSEHIIELPRWKHFSASFYVYVFIYIYMVTPPTTPRHAVCTVIYNITCSFFMFTFCGYLYIFIRTSSYKQKHNNILILFGEDPWQRIKKIIEPTKKYLETLWGVPLGENQKKTTKKNQKTKKQTTKNQKNKKNKTKKTKETQPIGDPAIPMVMFFCVFFFLVF